MKKLLVLPALIALVLLAGCAQDVREVDSIEVIRYAYEIDEGDLIPEVLKSWIFTDEEETAVFLNALNRRTKTDGELDIRPRDYSVTIRYTDGTALDYDLWLDEDEQARGVLMQGETAWMIHEVSNEVLQNILR